MKRLMLILTFCLVVVLLQPAAVSAVDAGSWPMFRQNPHHTGAVGSGDLEPPLKLKWKIPLNSIIDSSPAFSKTFVYVGTDSGYLYCIDVIEGKIEWKFNAGDVIISSPCVGYGNVYFGCYDGKLYALDAKTGELRFSFQTGSRIKSSPAVADDMVYFGSLDWNIYGLDAKSGKLKWKTKTKWSVSSSPTYLEGNLFIGSDDKSVYCLDGKTGKVLYTYETRGDVYATPIITEGHSEKPVPHIADPEKAKEEHIDYQKIGGSVISAPTLVDDKLYFGSFDKHIYSFRRETNRSFWEAKLGDTISATIAYIKSAEPQTLSQSKAPESAAMPTSAAQVFTSEKVIVGSKDGSIYAFAAQDGHKLWETTTNGFIYSSAAVTDKYVFIGSWDGHFYILDINTGVIIWKYKTGGWIRSSAALYNNVVVFGSRDGYLYAFVSERS